MDHQLLSLKTLIPMLQLAIGPVIVISGVGLLLLCMTNRFARVIDIARLVATDARLVGREELGTCRAKLGILSKRARILRTCIAMASVSVLLIAVLVIALFCSALVGFEIAGFLVALFVGSMGALIASMVCFIRDVNLSLQALWLDFPAEWSRVAGRGHDHVPHRPARSPIPTLQPANAPANPERGSGHGD